MPKPKMKMARKAGHSNLNLSQCRHPRTMGPWGSEVAWLRVHRNATIAPAMTHFQPMRKIVQRMLARLCATGELHTTLFATPVKAGRKKAVK